MIEYHTGDILKDRDWNEDLYMIIEVELDEELYNKYTLLDLSDHTRSFTIRYQAINSFYKKLT